MRGHPVMQWLLFVIAWGALWWPIHRVTHTTAAMPAPREEAPGSEMSVWLTLRFSRPPAAFTVRQGDRVVWSVDPADGNRFEQQVVVTEMDHTVELWVTANLPTGESAVEVIAEADGRARLARTLWVDGALDEPLVFSWGRHE